MNNEQKRKLLLENARKRINVIDMTLRDGYIDRGAFIVPIDRLRSMLRSVDELHLIFAQLKSAAGGQ